MILLSIILLICGVFATIVNFQRKQIALLMRQNKETAKEIKHFHRDHTILVNADLVFSKQLSEINQQLISMDNQLQSLENQRANDGSYQHAARILEMGGDKEEIVNSCHLSNAEAELLMNIQAYRAVIKRTPAETTQA